MSDEEWEFCAPYLTLREEKAPPRAHQLRAVFNALRWFVRAGCPWRLRPNDLPPWWAVQQQTRRWIKAGCFERMAADLRAVSRITAGRESVWCRRRWCWTAARCKGSKTHLAVDTLGHLLALRVTPADEQDRTHVGPLAKDVQTVTGKHVEKAFVDQGYTGEKAAAARRATRDRAGDHQAYRT